MTAQVYRGPLAAMQLPDTVLTPSLQTALGTKPLAALAVGDLDGDGHADLAVASGGQVSVVLSPGKIGSPFSLAWTTTLQIPADPVAAVALAIGQADGKGGNDLVVAVTTGPNGSSKYTQSLFAFFNAN